MRFPDSQRVISFENVVITKLMSALDSTLGTFILPVLGIFCYKKEGIC